MTQEDKNDLIKYLCASLPYKLKINIRSDYTYTMEDMELNPYHLEGISYSINYRNMRPYLRSFSKMTQDEKWTIKNRFCYDWWSETEGNPSSLWKYQIDIEDADSLIDFFNERHLDYLGLIQKGLALEAPDGMYEFEEMYSHD